MLVARASFVTVIAAALLAFAGNAAAATSMSITDLAADVAEPMRTNATADLPFRIVFTGDGTSCPEASSITVTLTVNSASLPAGVTATVEPGEVQITVPQGIHQTPPVAGLPITPFQQEASATLSLAAGEVAVNGTGTVTVNAEYAGGTPAGCQGALAAASASGSTNVTSLAPPPAPEPEVQEEKKGIPAPGFAFVAVLGAGLARVMGRRDSP